MRKRRGCFVGRSIGLRLWCRIKFRWIMSSFSRRIQDAIATEEPRLWGISENEANSRPGGGEGWSRKQELGHLIDSAINNRLRFTRAALEGEFVGASYDGPG